MGSFKQWMADNGDDLDHVLLCRPHVAAAFLPELQRHTGISLLYYGADLHFRRMRLEATVLDDRCIARQAAAMEMLERSVWHQVDVVMYPSDEETALVTETEPEVVARTLLPYSFADFAVPRPPVREPVILFVGSFAHLPNRDGLLWFIGKVFPLILARLPAARLTIAGSNPPLDVQALASDAISVQANVSDARLSQLYRSARVAAVPLRYGAGVKLKVVEAMHAGVPLVTTSIGAQGLPEIADVAVISDEPAAFADAVCTLLMDDAAWSARAQAQVAYVTARYSEAAFSNSPCRRWPNRRVAAPRDCLHDAIAAACPSAAAVASLPRYIGGEGRSDAGH